MRIALSLLSLLMMFPLIGKEISPTPSEDNYNNKQEIVESQEKQIHVHHSYEPGLQASRTEGKPLVIVMLWNSDSDLDINCSTELNETCTGVISILSESILSELANFVVLVPSGVNSLVYPPIEDPMFEEINKFKLLFQEESFPQGLSVVVVCVTLEGPGDILEVSPVPLDKETAPCTPFLESSEDEKSTSGDEIPTETEEKT